mmetsp:Transcript_76334/g.223829  ORF Transcript_76334/g.223829 Transcript_76334/m.223829 type:complete len:643 (-) Transcript_76334:98-2026(-)
MAPAFLDVLSGHWATVVFCTWTMGLMLGSHRLWRIPVLLLIGTLMATEVCCYFSLRWLVTFIEMLLTTRLFTRQKLHRLMQSANSFQEWNRWAAELDKVEGRCSWKANPQEKSYHPAILRTAVGKIGRAMASDNTMALMEHLRTCLSKNFGGHMELEVYNKSHSGTKQLIEEFVNQVEVGLDWLSEQVAQGRMNDDDLIACSDFVHDAGTAYGTSCLFLSGGGALGFYHFGVLRALLSEGLLPNVICGSSMGSIVSSYLACRTDEEALKELQELKELYDHVGHECGPMQGTKLWKLRQILKKGYIYEHADMLRHLEWFTKGFTFAEAFAKTGRILNITCTPTRTTVTRMPPMILNHLTAPNVTVASAAMASSCVPGLIPLVTLQEKVDGVLQPWKDMVWEKEEEDVSKGLNCSRRRKQEEPSLEEVQMRDGSFETDVPIRAMQPLFNIRFSIVSQVNPHIIPFFFNPAGAAGRPIRWPWRNFRGGFLLYLLELWLKEDMIKNLVILQKTGLLFNIFGVDWSYLFIQQDHGDVTIVPRATASDYFHVMDNEVSPEGFAKKVRMSERNTWRNFPQIQARMRLQRALQRVSDAVIRRAQDLEQAERDPIVRRCNAVHTDAFRLRGDSSQEASPSSTEHEGQKQTN